MKHLAVLSVLLLSSCVRPPDVPICRDLPERQVQTKDAFGIIDTKIEPNPVCIKEINESRCGFCVYTLSPKSIYVGEAPSHQLEGLTWNQIRPSAVLLPADSYGKVKEYIINACKKNQDCQDDIDKWRTKFHGLEEDKK